MASSSSPFSMWVLTKFYLSISLATLVLLVFVPDRIKFEAPKDQLLLLMILNKQDWDFRQYLLTPLHSSYIFRSIGSFPQSRSFCFLYYLQASSPQSISYSKFEVLLLSLKEDIMLKITSPLARVSSSGFWQMWNPLFQAWLRMLQSQGKLTTNMNVLPLLVLLMVLKACLALSQSVNPRMKAEKKKKFSWFSIFLMSLISSSLRTATMQMGSLRLLQLALGYDILMPLCSAKMGKMKQPRSMGSFDSSRTLLRDSRMNQLLKAQFSSNMLCLASLDSFWISALSLSTLYLSLGSLLLCSSNWQNKFWYYFLFPPFSVYFPMQKLQTRKYLIMREELTCLQAGRIRDRSLLVAPRQERVMSMFMSVVFLLMRVFISSKSGRRRVPSWLTLILLLDCSPKPPPLLVSLLQLPITIKSISYSNPTNSPPSNISCSTCLNPIYILNNSPFNPSSNFHEWKLVPYIVSLYKSSMNRLLLGPVLVVLALTSIISPPSSIRLNQVGAPSPKELFFPSTPTDNPVAIQSTPTSAISSLQAMKSLLTQKYQDMIGNTPAPQKQTNRTNSNAGTNQNASQQVKQSVKQYQKQLMQQYNSAQNNLTFNDSVGDNIDNGLNNSIRGAKNIIHEGNSNRISGMANQVNGSNNVIGGHNSKVHGSGNIVMSLPAGTPLPPPPPMPQLPQMPKIPQIPKKIDDLKPQIAVHLNETKLNQVKDQESVLLWTNNTEAIEKCSNNETSENSSSNETQINETEIIVDKQANQQQLAEGGMEVFADASLLPSNQHIPAPKSSANTPNSSSAATSHISTVINDATVKNSWGAALALTLALFLLLLLL